MQLAKMRPGFNEKGRIIFLSFSSERAGVQGKSLKRLALLFDDLTA